MSASMVVNIDDIYHQSKTVHENASFDRSLDAMNYHETMADGFGKYPTTSQSHQTYMKMLECICHGDTVDRTIFQNQLWWLTDTVNILKHDHPQLIHKKWDMELKSSRKRTPPPKRFTKILTKYSMEYNNQTFINKMCNELCIDRQSLFAEFNRMHKMDKTERDLYSETIHERYSNINIVDINRMLRYVISSAEMGG
jgi:hypothetical protein